MFEPIPDRRPVARGSLKDGQWFPAAETALERLHAENEQDRGLLERLAIQSIKEWVPAIGRAAERVSRGIEGSLDPTKEPDYLGAAMYGAAVNPVTAPLLGGINAVMPGEAVDLFPSEPEKRAALGRGAVAGAVTSPAELSPLDIAALGLQPLRSAGVIGRTAGALGRAADIAGSAGALGFGLGEMGVGAITDQRERFGGGALAAGMGAFGLGAEAIPTPQARPEVRFRRPSSRIVQCI